MNTELQMFPLEFKETYQYVTEQLCDGNTLAQELLKDVDFKKGRFFALLHSLGDKTKIYEFRNGSILPENPLEPVLVHGKVYPGREKSHSVHQLALYLKSVLLEGQCCYFDDVMRRTSDPIKSDMQGHLFYFQEEVYLKLKKDEFSLENAEQMIHYSNAQWYYMNVVSENESGLSRDLTPEQLKKIASKTSHIVIGAYDMEGFVIWERLV